VLVHGSSSGGWVWRGISQRLHARGHEVYAPTLTGLGERVHLAHPGIDLSLHVEDVCAVLEWEELDDVVLVGFSYGGMVIAGVADRMPERIHHLVYFDALVPLEGQSSNDLLAVHERGALEGDGDWIDPAPALALHPVSPDPATRAWMERKLVRHPQRSFTEPIHYRQWAAVERLPRTFIYCSDKLADDDPSAIRVRTEPNWNYRTLPTTHYAMLSMPDEVTDILIEAGS
jgi:pimeloyl-ACP methyl ester carboxylesterase